MSEPENFLARWSRRKLDDEESVATDKADNKARQPIQPASVPTKDAATSEGKTEPAFDLSKLPSLDSITADTDIRAFWLPGVPEALRHAALRRVWVADPAIRDFVTPADYAWDFTAENSMAGFGSLDPADLPRLMREILPPQEIQEPASRAASTTLTGEKPQSEPQIMESAQETDEIAPTPAQGANSFTTNETNLQSDKSELLHRNEQAELTPREDKKVSLSPAHGRRGHGRALPQ